MTQMDNILSIKHAISERLRNVRRVAKISQIALAERSGVSLGSIKRFERTGEISLASLLKLAMALGYESDFNNLFTRKNYQSIFDVVKDGGNDAK
ncbi:MAG: helix-turn-helix domain-containing protein [Candidatus Enterousia sp.]